MINILPADVLLRALFLALCWLPLAHADQALDRFNQFFAEMKTLQASFHQEVFDDRGRRLQQSSGHLQLLRPGRFRWEYATPNQQLILADGKNLWIYDPDLEQATVKPMAESLGSAPIALLTQFSTLEVAYAIRKGDAHDNLEWVQLIPKIQDTDFHRVEIGFDGKELRRMELYDQFGQKTVITLSELKMNEPINPSRFRFQAPAGTDIIGSE